MAVVPPASKKSGLPDNWDFYQDGVWMAAPDKIELVKKVREYRVANNLPVGDPSQEVEDFNAAKTRTVYSQRIDVTLREKVVKWLESHLRLKNKFVDEQEADRRAAICAKCPRNEIHWREGQKCRTCIENANRAGAIILMGRKQHRPLGACDILQQQNTVAVWLEEDKVQNEELPDFCWRKVSQNDTIPT